MVKPLERSASRTGQASSASADPSARSDLASCSHTQRHPISWRQPVRAADWASLQRKSHLQLNRWFRVLNRLSRVMNRDRVN
jgi:hypothetical protein